MEQGQIHPPALMQSERRHCKSAINCNSGPVMTGPYAKIKTLFSSAVLKSENRATIYAGGSLKSLSAFWVVAANSASSGILRKAASRSAVKRT